MDTYSAIWVSHSSISDFLHCRRAYFLKNLYRDPKTHHKVKVMTPPLALGQVLHDVIEKLSNLKVEQRNPTQFMSMFEKAWKNVEGKRGGFTSADTQARYMSKGREMIARLAKNPGALARKAVKIREELPHYIFSEVDKIVLCGKIDWLEYLPETDSVHIIDFKTSKYDEPDDSLQLPIYYLLVKNCQKREVTKASYWYLERQDVPQEVTLPDEYESYDRILDIAKQIKAARQLQKFTCEHNGCQYCKSYEAVVQGKSEFVYVDSFGADVHILSDKSSGDDTSEIL